jgi:glycosyltransferase involved in cell wall biosynthesis
VFVPQWVQFLKVNTQQQSFDFLESPQEVNVENHAESHIEEPKEPVDLPVGQEQPVKPLRIAILGYRSHPFAGGQGIYIKYLSKALVEAGHQVDVISGEPYPHLDERVRLIKMPGLNLYEHGLLSLRPHHLTSYANIVEWVSKFTGGFAEPYAFGRRVNAYLQEHGGEYDLIHDNQTLASGLVDIQKRMPLVTTVHHPITSDLQIALNASHKWWEKLLIRRWYSFLLMQSRVIKQLKNVVTVSECSQQDIAKAFGIEKAGLHLIYCGINTEEFAPRNNIQRKPMRLMATASADQPLKGLRFLLQAYANLLPEYPELELLVVGKPTPGGTTDVLLKKLGIDQKVQFVSGISTERMVDYYAEATIAVVPSLYEGFGLPAGEAMACEVPVVSTKGGALPEVVGDAGILVPTQDAAAIAKAIKELLDDPERRVVLGKAGRERIMQKFCWHVAANTFTQYYHQVIQDHANS